MPPINRKRKGLSKLGSSMNQRKAEFVEKKAKLIMMKRVKKYVFCSYIALKTKASQLKTLDTYTYLYNYILSYLAHRILVNHSKRLH